MSYSHILYDNWTLDLKYRYYQQTAADFYSDLFASPSLDEKDYRGRDKEISDFDDHTVSLYLSYARPLKYRWADRVALSLQWDRIWFSYNNFTDLTDENATPGEESLYEFEADVFKILFTVWY